SETFQYKGGISEFVEHLNKTKEPVHQQVVSIVAEHALENGAAPLGIELAMQWNSSYQEQIFPYTNNVHNKDGGTHLTGLRAGLTKVFNQYGTAQNLCKKVKNRRRVEGIREGLTRGISSTHPDPIFESHTKNKVAPSEEKMVVE